MNTTVQHLEIQPHTVKWQLFVAPLRRLFAVVGLASLGLLLPLVVLALWQHAYNQAWLPVQILPAPSLVWQTFWELIESGDLQTNLLISLKRIAWSVLIGGGLGLLIGFSVGISRKAYAYIYPTFDVVSQFPVVGWIPLLIIFLGIDEGLKIAAISLAVIVPVTVSTYKGIQNISQSLLEVGQVYVFTNKQTLFRVVIPGALPSIFSGIRQGVMQAWLSLVFVELLASSEGIGYLMVWGRQLLQLDIVFVGIIVIGVVGLILDNSLRFIESRLQVWQPQRK